MAIFFVGVEGHSGHSFLKRPQSFDGFGAAFAENLDFFSLAEQFCDEAHGGFIFPQIVKTVLKSVNRNHQKALANAPKKVFLEDITPCDEVKVVFREGTSHDCWLKKRRWVVDA